MEANKNNSFMKGLDDTAKEKVNGLGVTQDDINNKVRGL